MSHSNLNNFMKENWRICPPAPIALTRVATEDFQIESGDRKDIYQMKKGDLIFGDAYSLGNDYLI